MKKNPLNTIHPPVGSPKDPVPERQPEVHAAIERLDSSIVCLGNNISALVDRLSPAINGGMLPEPANTARTSGSCAFSESLFQLTDRVESIDDTVRALLAALEI